VSPRPAARLLNRILRVPDHPIGGPDYHDLTAGIGGAPPARSALTARLILAAAGLLFCTTAAILFAIYQLPAIPIAIVAAGAFAYLIDIVVATRRKLSGEHG
jgi:hypothetical protein